jgi:DNA damage-inducible protein 1
MTVMTATVAQRCGLMHLLDVRFAGTASGVGSAPILGRVHMAPLRAGGHFFPVSITVMDQPGGEWVVGVVRVVGRFRV